MTAAVPRDVGAIEFLQGALPAVALDGLAAATWLGAVPLAVGLLVAHYWFVGRDRGAIGVGAGLGAAAVTIGLKAAFALPRPPAALRLVEATGFGFPSGHALVATVAWGYLALAVDRGTREARWALAAAVVGLVAVSRVALGVHHAGDVVAGVAVGAALLVVVTQVGGATGAFGVAAALALFAALVTGGADDAMLVLGGALAGVTLAHRLSVLGIPRSREALLPAGGVGAGVGAILLAGYRWELGAPVEFGVGAVAVAGLLALPWLVERYRSGPRR